MPVDSPRIVQAGTLALPEAPHVVGVMPNAAHQSSAGVFDQGRYDLAVVEFDDQGRCYDRRQMQGVAGWLDHRADQDVIIVVFVHGWKHDARSDDDNLVAFMEVLRKTVDHETAEQTATGGTPRRVLGVFVGWRGLSVYDRFELSQNLTFWGRQEAGRRVSVGSVRELLGRFRQYRNRRKDQGHAPLLVIVGHSFGGMIVYSALAQSLIEAAAAPVGEVTPRFADLVLLVNPAVEGARYLPIYDLVRDWKTPPSTIDQLPVFICVTARNDWATGWAFPLGNAVSWLSESYRDRHERQAMMNTIGHLAWMTTHILDRGDTEGAYHLDPFDASRPRSPFWVVQASPAVINGHNDIFGKTFLRFIADRLFAHVEKSIR